MASMIPMLFYGLEVPPGDIAISAKPDIPSAFRITMAAIDPSAETEGDEGAPARATLKIIRQSPLDFDGDDDYDDEDEDDFDADLMDQILAEGESDEEDDEDDEDLNGGPSDPAKSKKAKKEAARREIKKLLEEEGMDIEDDEDAPNGINGTKRSSKALGKMPASEDDDEDDEEDDDEDDEDDDDEYGAEIEEFVLCTLDPSKTYQQPIDITIGENERVWFKVSGTHTIYLSGNYVELPSNVYDEDDEDDEDEDEYDLEPDSDELDEYDEEDELDDLSDPRITEVDDEDEAPALVKAEKKGKNKRLAEDDSAPTLDELVAQARANGDDKKSKKQKKNDGSAAAAAASDPPSSAKSDKKVTFAKELEKGPTPTKESKGNDGKTALGVKKVQGVTIDDKKLGTGPAAKSGDRVSMRYIGKLEKDGKVFDSNKKGKPFSFKLGAGEVIKGWDIGIQGLSAGGERRITIPAHLAYGSKGTGPIPGNATLVFDVKLLEIGKGK